MVKVLGTPPLQLLSMTPTSYIQYCDHFVVQTNRKTAEKGAMGINGYWEKIKEDLSRSSPLQCPSTL